MKTFFLENKQRVFLLGVPIVFLIILWSLNIYQVWWSLTPWKKLGSPPYTTIVKIGQIKFPGSYSPDFNLLHLMPGNDFRAPQPSTYVYGRIQIYMVDAADNWMAVESTANPMLESIIIENEKECAALLKMQWRFQDENLANVRLVDERGYCYSEYYQYAIYRVDEDGSVWIKYLNSKYPEYFRARVTLYTCLLLGLLLSVLTKILFRSSLLDPKPDYYAR